MCIRDRCFSSSQNTSCQLWRFYSKTKEVCQCCSTVNNVIHCELNYVFVEYSRCLTWNNITEGLEISRCLLMYHDSNLCDNYEKYGNSISANITGPELNTVTCKPYRHNVGSASMAMGQQHLLMVSLVLTVLSTNTYGF